MKFVYKKILITNLRKIGDTIMATSLAYMLKQLYPEAKIYMLVTPKTTSIVENNPIIDKVFIYNYSHKEKIAGIKTIVKQLKKEHFDISFSADNKPRSALITYLANIPKRIGYENISFRNCYLKFLYTNIIKPDYTLREKTPVENYKIFLEKFSHQKLNPKMILPNISDEDITYAENLLKPFNDKMKFALCIHSGIPFKDYSVENFAKVINLLRKKIGAHFIVLGSPNDKNKVMELQKYCDIEIVNLAGKTTLPQMIYILQKMDFLLSVDTGTAHLAAASKVPSLVIFGGTSHYMWKPFGDNVNIIYPKIQCYNCNDKERKNCTDYKCLKFITPSEIVEKILREEPFHV